MTPGVHRGGAGWFGIDRERFGRDREAATGSGLLRRHDEVKLGAGSTLSFAAPGLRGQQIAFQHRSAVVGVVRVFAGVAQLGCRVIRSRIDNTLEATARPSSRRRSLCSTDQLFDLTSYTRHIGRDTTGNLLSKGAVDRSGSI